MQAFFVPLPYKKPCTRCRGDNGNYVRTVQNTAITLFFGCVARLRIGNLHFYIFKNKLFRGKSNNYFIVLK